MQDVIEFLRQLRLHNDRTWFEANKSWYRDAQSQFAAFVEELIAGIARFDSSVQGLAAKDCTYRIYCDYELTWYFVGAIGALEGYLSFTRLILNFSVGFNDKAFGDITQCS